jgi:short-subunit dehydrogenase
MSKGVCVVVGVGPGNGAAIGARFAANDYRVALCARNKHRLDEISGTIKDSRTFSYDVKNTEASPKVFAQIREQVGPVMY